MPLEARNVAFGYTPARPVLRDVSAVFRPGRITAILGPNGSGKTTLLRLLLNLRTPTSGRITLAGRAVADLTRHERAAHLAYIPQSSSVAFPFSVRQVVLTGRYAAPQSPDHRRAADEALDLLDLRDLADEPFGLLSAGQQQRVTVARALAQLDSRAGPGLGSRALLADEPVSAMDPRHALHTFSILRERARAGIIIAAVLHDLPTALACADDAVLLSDAGTVLTAGPAQEVLNPDNLERLFGVRFEALRGPSGRAAALIPLEASTLNSDGSRRP
ncbi:MAG: ABC transporter ATP-binding protein [Phycisphaerales bacterium]|nr:ABC transporter ATP-binding protein [Phycisphaerales bacterium]